MGISGYVGKARAQHIFRRPTPRRIEILTRLIGQVGTGGNLDNDAHLAALALEHRASIVSYDGNFGRFGGLRWDRPDALTSA